MGTLKLVLSNYEKKTDGYCSRIGCSERYVGLRGESNIILQKLHNEEPHDLYCS